MALYSMFLMASSTPKPGSCRASDVPVRGNAWCHSTCLLSCMRWETYLGVIHGTVLHVLDGQLYSKAGQLQSLRCSQLKTGPFHAAASAQQRWPVDIRNLPLPCAHDDFLRHNVSICKAMADRYSVPLRPLVRRSACQILCKPLRLQSFGRSKLYTGPFHVAVSAQQHWSVDIRNLPLPCAHDDFLCPDVSVYKGMADRYSVTPAISCAPINLSDLVQTLEAAELWMIRALHRAIPCCCIRSAAPVCTFVQSVPIQCTVVDA